VTGPRLPLVLLGLGLPAAAGWLLACLLTPLPKGTARLFRWSLGTALGLGMGSLSYMLWRILGGAWTPPYLLGETALFIFVFFVLACILKKSVSAVPVVGEPAKAPGWLTAASLVAAAGAAGIFLARTLVEPHGGWDAWAIWNLKARFFVRGGEAWTRMLSPVLDWAHPDYPLLLPSTIARWWSYAGSESFVWPALAALVSAAAMAGLMWEALRLLRSGTAAAVALLCLAGTYGLAGQAASQYAEAPLALFMAASLACLVLAERTGGRGPLVLAGACAGFAAWTKNEGLLFIPVLAAAWLLAGRRWRTPKLTAVEFAWMVVGALPGLAAVAVLKLSIPGGNDLVTGLGAGALAAKLADPQRYWMILKTFTLESLKLVMPAALLAAWGLSGFRRSSDNQRGALLCLVAAAGMLLGYGLVYLLTPYDLAWHLSTSASRLLMGVWPAALLGMLLIFRFEE